VLDFIRNRMFYIEHCRVVRLTILLLIGFAFNFGMVSKALALNLSIGKKSDATQVEFQGKAFWDYWLEQKEAKLYFKIDPLPQKQLQKLKDYKDDLVTKVEVVSEDDKQIELRFHLKDSQVETFAYQMESPSRLLIDIYRNPNAKKVKKKTAKKKVAKRKPASEMPILVEEQEKPAKIPEPKEIPGIFDGADPNYERFSIKDYEVHQDALIASRQKVFVPFPFILTKDNFIQDLEKHSPIYKIKKENTKQNQEARLLLTIFNNQRYASFLEALEVFRAKHPDTKWQHMLRFMEADAHYKLWKETDSHPAFVQAMALYKKLLEDYPKSPLYQRTRMLIAYGQLQKNNYVAALQEFLSIREDMGKFEFSDEINISIGDSLLALNKFDDAIKNYQKVIDESENEYSQYKAKFKIADVYAKQKQYEKTISHIESIIKENPEAAKKYPNSVYNIAESQFRLKEYRKAHENYLQFLKNFPMNDHGAFALHRVGELLDILTLEKDKIRGAFLENTFRFPKTPGAFLSDLRIKMRRAPEMKAKEMEMLAKEIKDFLNENVNIDGLDHYITSYMEEAYYQRGDLQKSWDILQRYYKKNITSPTIPFYKKRIARNLTRQIENAVTNGQPIQALRIYGKNKDLWLKEQDRMDLKYYLGRTFEKTTAYKDANKTYMDLLNNLFAIEGTEEERKRQLFEHIPSKESVMLRIAQVNYQQKDYEKAIEYLNLIKDDGKLEKDEIYERSALTADISIQRGNYKLAEKHLNFLVNKWKFLPQRVAAPYTKLAEVYKRRGQLDKAHEIYDRMIYHYKDSQSINIDTYTNVLEKKAMAYLDNNQDDKAVPVLKDLLSAGPKDKHLNSRYKLGQIYFNQGNLAKAEEFWAPLQNIDEGKVWYNLAQEKLQEAKWKDNYEKYIERLPAGTTDQIRRQ